ncbi:MAG: DUF58 domain-containing protein [Alkalispirochaetaceae bacterium]
MSSTDSRSLNRRIRRLKLTSSRLVEELLAGNYRSVFKGPGIEFDETREYVDGDDVRLIDWNVTGRLGGVFTKTFREERELTLFVVVDSSASLRFGSGETTAKEASELLFALLSLAAVQNNDKVGALFFSDTIERWIPPVKGKRHAFRLIQEMVDREPSGRGSNLPLALRTVGESLKRRGICVVISDFFVDGYQREMAILSKKHDVIAVRLTDPLLQELPDVGMVTFEDPETGGTTRIQTSSRRLRRHYAEYRAQQRQQWLRDCLRTGAKPLEISSEQDAAEAIIRFFRRRRR